MVLQIKDNDRFLQSARQGKQFGFGGKLCIHPDQIPLTHEVFTPSEADVAHARAVVAAFEAAEERVLRRFSWMAISSTIRLSTRVNGFLPSLTSCSTERRLFEIPGARG